MYFMIIITSISYNRNIYVKIINLFFQIIQNIFRTQFIIMHANYYVVIFSFQSENVLF